MLSIEPMSRWASTICHTSSAVPITHARRSQSAPRKAIPGNSRIRSASSASASTIAPLVRPVRLASRSTNASIRLDRRMLNGADFVAITRGYHGNYTVMQRVGSFSGCGDEAAHVAGVEHCPAVRFSVTGNYAEPRESSLFLDDKLVGVDAGLDDDVHADLRRGDAVFAFVCVVDLKV